MLTHDSNSQNDHNPTAEMFFFHLILTVVWIWSVPTKTYLRLNFSVCNTGKWSLVGGAWSWGWSPHEWINICFVRISWLLRAFGPPVLLVSSSDAEQMLHCALRLPSL
jgi:hypothetical protein